MEKYKEHFGYNNTILFGSVYNGFIDRICKENRNYYTC